MCDDKVSQRMEGVQAFQCDDICIFEVKNISVVDDQQHCPASSSAAH